MRTTRFLLSVALVAMFCAGCGEQPISESPLPPQVPNTTYRVTVHEVYGANEPVGLMTFDRDAAGDPTQGTIFGKVHGWPFPHADAGGDTGEGLFTYRTDFTVTRSATNKLPEAASGIRTVYFHPDRQTLSLSQPMAMSTGQPIIRDSVKVLFSFEGQGSVEIAETSQQIWTEPFTWQGATITPPWEQPRTRVKVASYSPRYSGYVFR